MRTSALLLLTALAVLLSPPAKADELFDDPGRLAAVQQRKFKLRHELFAAGGLLPLDAFYKGVGPVVGYAFHFNDAVAWEVVRAGYSFNANTSLRTQLEKDYGVAPTKFEQVTYHLESTAILSPLYGKFSLFNSSVVHAELFGLAGGTLARTTDSFHPGANVGVGLRFFLSPSISTRFETRYHFLFGGGTATQFLDLALGLGIDLGGAD